MTNIEKRLKLSSNEIIKGNISNCISVCMVRHRYSVLLTTTTLNTVINYISKAGNPSTLKVKHQHFNNTFKLKDYINNCPIPWPKFHLRKWNRKEDLMFLSGKFLRCKCNTYLKKSGMQVFVVAKQCNVTLFIFFF